MFKSIILTLLLIFSIQPAQAEYIFKSETTDTTSAANPSVYETHLSISSSDGLTAGDWLILFSGGFTVDSNTAAQYIARFREDNGSLSLHSNQIKREPESPRTWLGNPSSWWYMGENSSGSENFIMQIKASVAGVAVRITEGEMMAINLTYLKKNVDWVLGSPDPGGTDDTSPSGAGSYIDLVSATIPANNQGKTWLVLTKVWFDMGAAGRSAQIRLEEDGTTIWPPDGNVNTYSEDASDNSDMSAASIYIPADASAHTLQLQYQVSNTAIDVYEGNILAINLDAFSKTVRYKQSTGNCTNAANAFADCSNYTQDYVFDRPGKYMIIGYHGGKNTTTQTDGYRYRLDIDNGTYYGYRGFDGINSDESDEFGGILLGEYEVTSAVTKEVAIANRNMDSDGSTASGQEGMIVVFKDEEKRLFLTH